MSQYHTPVMVSEVLEGLQVGPGKHFIDATLGGGGHGIEIEKRGGVLLGMDTDSEAVEEAKKGFRDDGLGERVKVVQGNFKDIQDIAKKNGFDIVDGILFDLGVSSHQLDTEARGFSYRFGDAPLDLRLNQNEGIPASEYIAHTSEDELYEILATYSEEEHSRAVSAAVVRSRVEHRIATTGDLLKIIEDVVGQRGAKGVASRVFQALRIYVNDEFGALKMGLRGAKELLKPGGRLVVISFHSLEDRIVKQFLKTDGWRLITKKPVVAGEQEQMENRRSRSAKLRVAEKIL